MEEGSKTKGSLSIVQQKLIKELIAVIVGGAIMLIPPPVGLTVQAMITIGLLVWAIINWMLAPIPDFIVVIIMCCLWVILGIAPFTVAFGSFGSTTLWLVVGVLGIGTAVTKSGLLYRITLMIMKLFPPTFSGQVMSLLASGTVVAPLIPSTTAKVAIAGPLVNSIGDALGLAPKSKGRGGLFVAMYTGFCLTGPIFVSASFFGYIILGVMPEDIQSKFTWGYWLLSVLPWGIVMLLASFFAITRIYKPKEKVTISKEKVREQIAELGPMKKEEKITMTIVLICIVFWILESVLNVNSAIPALLGLGLLISFGVLTVQDYVMKTPWNIITFIGGIMGLATVLGQQGINTWIADVLGPIMGSIAGNPYIFVIVLTIIVFFARFIVADLITPLTLFPVLLTPFCIAGGISPWIAGFVVYVMNMMWVVQYQNPNFVIGFAASGGEEKIGYNQTIKACIIYVGIVIVGLLISVPYWRLLGLIQ
ncbi:MAG: anion permease [Oscillospiraceae bacterium]|nr:anion permease [Oscillospiraceae bacterium]